MEFTAKNRARLEAFVHMSAHTGARVDYVQGGGGNTSVKLDDRLMAIKASGYCLKDIQISAAYAVLDYAALRDFYKANEPADFADVEKEGAAFTKKTVVPVEGMDALRPSVEAGFHSILDVFVSHTHSVYANLASCAENGREIADAALAGAAYSWGFVPYTNPGSMLTFIIRDELCRVEQKTGKKPAVIFMENHGLIVHGNDEREVLRVQDDVNARIAKFFGIENGAFPAVSVEKAGDVYAAACPYLRQQLISGDFTEEQFILKPLYPDQLVFLGEGFRVGEGVPEKDGCTANIKTGEALINMPEKKALVIAETLTAVVFIHRHITAKGYAVKTMGDAAKDFIANWESEKYRKSLAAKGK